MDKSGVAVAVGLATISVVLAAVVFAAETASILVVVVLVAIITVLGAAGDEIERAKLDHGPTA